MWTNDAAAKRLLKDIDGLRGDDIEERKEAIVVMWLNTVQHQQGRLEVEIERLKKWLLFIRAFELHAYGGHTGAAQAALDGRPAPTW